jgi:hypothetical protein
MKAQVLRVLNRALLLAGVQAAGVEGGAQERERGNEGGAGRVVCGVLVDMRERGMRGLHELVLEFTFGAWGKGTKTN